VNPLLAEGLVDAVGFIAGVMVAWGIATLVGFDPLSPDWSDKAMAGVLMCGLGGGAGVHLARRWRKSRARRN
jgi:hypothetical protein